MLPLRQPDPRISSTSAFLRKLSLNAEKNWHQNSGAKRSLDHNYLPRAEATGHVQILPLHTAIQEIAEECLLETPEGWLGGRFNDTWLPAPYSGALHYRDAGEALLQLHVPALVERRPHVVAIEADGRVLRIGLQQLREWNRRIAQRR